ncbi:type I-B CRISPR-associated protein Cas5b [Abyssisolibacter fermentans]|uniref:type I-B CRISPR-associated protein Cas5b n=1 Tax=Abyssisolibacter fermentans TaxID=1766203 RepID=UPI001FA77BAE|nr:type I-B CRISPR-associated protein Cas5b [Abyssisolibacter fermentans]
MLKFRLSGKTAHFKKPDVNSFAYYSYSHIHRIALMGILGAVIGLKGYAQQDKNEVYPEFYQKLKTLKVGIVPPKVNRGYFSKKIIAFNNSVGYANEDANKMPCNLIVREQWLEDVCWDIYLDLKSINDKEVEDKLEKYILNDLAEYIPYLGKNDHYAVISNSEILECDVKDGIEKIDSIFYYDAVKLDDYAYDDEETPFLFKDYFPCSLAIENNMYEFREIGFTNRCVDEINDTVINHNDLNIALI